MENAANDVFPVAFMCSQRYLQERDVDNKANVPERCEQGDEAVTINNTCWLVVAWTRSSNYRPETCKSVILTTKQMFLNAVSKKMRL